MNNGKGKWLYRTAGAVGLAGGICLVAGGAAHADDTAAAPADGSDAQLSTAINGLLKPLANPLNGGGISAPGLGVSAQDVSLAPATVGSDRPGEDRVVTGQLRDFTLPGLPSLDGPPSLGGLPSLDGPSNPHILPAPAFGLPPVPLDDAQPGVTQKTIGNNVLSSERLRLLPTAPAAPTASVDRDALGVTALTAPTGQRAEDLPSLPVANKVLDQVSVNGTPLTGQDLGSTLPLKPNVSMDPKGPQLSPVTNTLSNPTGVLSGVGGAGSAPAGQPAATPPRHAAPSSQAPASSSQTPAPSSQAPASSSQAPAPSAQAPAPSSQTSASSQAPAPSAQAPAPSSQSSLLSSLTSAPSAQAPAPSAQAPAPSARASAPSARAGGPEALPVVSQLPVVKGLANGTDPGAVRSVTNLPVVQTLVGGGQTATPADATTGTTQTRRPSPRPRPNERPVAAVDPEYT